MFVQSFPCLSTAPLGRLVIRRRIDFHQNHNAADFYHLIPWDDDLLTAAKPIEHLPARRYNQRKNRAVARVDAQIRNETDAAAVKNIDDVFFS